MDFRGRARGQDTSTPFQSLDPDLAPTTTWPCRHCSGYAVYHVALKQTIGISLVVNHCTADVRVTLDRIVTLVLVPVELSTSIYGSHTATYVVNAYVPQICVYVHSKHIKYVFTCKYDPVTSNGVNSLRD